MLHTLSEKRTNVWSISMVLRKQIAALGMAGLLLTIAGPVGVQAGDVGCGLPPLDLSGMRLFNYNGSWHASEWANGASKIPWHFNHVRQTGSEVTLLLDAKGAPQLQAVSGTPAQTAGLWESDVTLPQMREGVVVAPLWIYDRTTKDEVDFEFAGRSGLTVSMHAWPGGNHITKTIPVLAGTDFSNRRACFGIKVDKAAGKVDMLVDGKVIYTWDKSQQNFFVSQPMRPFIEMWAADPANAGLSEWTGKFAGFAPGENMLMTIHGYRFSNLEKVGTASP
jgi:hypothetical protein